MERFQTLDGGSLRFTFLTIEMGKRNKEWKQGTVKCSTHWKNRWSIVLESFLGEGRYFSGIEAIRDEATYHMLDHPYCKMCSKTAA